MSIRSETEHLKQEVDSRISTLKCKVKSQKKKNKLFERTFCNTWRNYYFNSRA